MSRRRIHRIVIFVVGSIFFFSALPSSGAAKNAESVRDAILATSELSGGLAIQIGCQSGAAEGALVLPEPFVVQTLEQDPSVVDAARRSLRKRGLYGRISVVTWDGKKLPYRDNLVNLVVVTNTSDISREKILRVLAPNGVCVTLDAGLSVSDSFRKPWPSEIDQWTHFLHGPDNNAVGKDQVVAAPERLRWLADPRHLRSHEHLNSISALVSANGRIFMIIDEGPVSAVIAQPKWRIVARDAFNGVLLWKHDIGPWEGHFRVFRSGPPELARRLVAVGDRVYASLGYNKPVAEFDAATGRLLQTYEATKGGLELIVKDGTLFAVTGTIDEQAYRETARRYLASPPPRHKAVVAVETASGRLLWRRAGAETDELMPTTLATAGGRIVFQNTRQLICLDAESGRELWRADRPVYTTRLSWSAPTVVATDSVILSSDGPTGGLPADVRRGQDHVTWINSDRDIRKHPKGDLVAFDAETGQRLWTGESLEGFCSPSDVFVIGERVWAGGRVAPSLFGLDVGRDLRTGQVTWTPKGDLPPVGGHARCYRNKATERFLILGGVGVEFLDIQSTRWSADFWVRGTCQYGVMPCNGLLYVPPDSCACRPNVRLHGFAAMAGAATAGQALPPIEDSVRTQRGPAYGGIPDQTSGATAVDDWPTYRRDAARSGSTAASVGDDLRTQWRVELNGRLTPPTAAGGRVYVAEVAAHTLHALDVETGRSLWCFIASGPIDSPPTIVDGRVVFGSRDGRVYCLRASDGQLAWSFQAAPGPDTLMAPLGLESVWPVHGSVLVRDGRVWCVAGRSSYLDGGLRLYAIDLASGERVIEKVLDGRNPQAWAVEGASKKANSLPGALPDILSSSEDLIFLGWTVFDLQGNLTGRQRSHLFSATGFLDDTWWHRTYWQYGSWMRGGFGGWPQAARQVPAGRLLVFNDEMLYGFGRSEYDPGNPNAVHAGHIGVIKDTYQDSGRVDYTQNPYRLFAVPKPPSDPAAGRRTAAPATGWQTEVPILVRGMVLAGDTLFIAGPVDGAKHEGLGLLDTAQPGRLLAVQPADGRWEQRQTLPASSVLDGLIAAQQRLFLCGTDGAVYCLAESTR